MPVDPFTNGVFLGFISGFLAGGLLGYFVLKITEDKYHRREKLIREGKL